MVLYVCVSLQVGIYEYHTHRVMINSRDIVWLDKRNRSISPPCYLKQSPPPAV